MRDLVYRYGDTAGLLAKYVMGQKNEKHFIDKLFLEKPFF